MPTVGAGSTAAPTPTPSSTATSPPTGVGTTLPAHAARAVVHHATATAMYLWVLERNTAAQRFHHARGADRVETATVTPPGGNPARLNGTLRKFRMAWPDATGPSAAADTGRLRARVVSGRTRP